MFCGRGDSHKHGAQFKKVVVLRILHLDYTPRIQTTTDFLPLHLNQLI